MFIVGALTTYLARTLTKRQGNIAADYREREVTTPGQEAKLNQSEKGQKLKN